MYLTENRFSRKEIGVRQIITIACVTLCANEFLDSNFDQAVIDKISIFHEMATNCTYFHNNCNFKSII